MGIWVPCGKCRPCKIAKASEWAARMIHEGDYHKSNVFSTLTYSDDNLPKNLELSERHLTLFFKSLRKHLNNRLIKYFACGEYGETTSRPHYHAILFNIEPCLQCYSCTEKRLTGDTPKNDCKIIRFCWKYAPRS